MSERSQIVESGQPVLDPEEQQAMDDLLAAVNRIAGWGLRANRSELTQAVHVIQGFVIQRMLQRIAPEHWGAWYDDALRGR